jgi:cobalt-zinc-cadmium efflux system protein
VTRTKRLWLVFIINAVMMIALAVVGFATNSLGVLAAAGEYIADAAAIGLTLFSLNLAKRPATARRSFGYHRATVLAALANTTLVLFVCGNVLVNAFWRLARGGETVRGGPAFVVSIIAMLSMGAAALLLLGDDDLSVRSVLLDTAGDALASGAVAIVSGIIWLTDGKYTWLDPIVAVAVVAFIGWHAWRLLRELTTVLLQWTPKDLDLTEIHRTIASVEGVSNVHDVHVWSLTADAQVLSAHIVTAQDLRVSESTVLIAKVKEELHHKHDIEHVTLEVESAICVPDLFCVSPITVSERHEHSH